MTSKHLLPFFMIPTFALLAATGTGVAQSGTSQATEQFPGLGRSIESSMKQWNIPGTAVAIVQGSAPVYLKGFGVRNVQTREPVTPDTLFDIGSCTKAFTSASIAMLVDDGKLHWDDKVEQSIPYFHLYDPLADESVTLRDLLTHRTGLPGADLIWDDPSVTREEVVHRVAYVHPSAGFRTTFQYQNAMYITLGVAVGRVSGGSWDDFVKQRIFTPLEMTESDTSALDAVKSADFATPHALRNGKLTPIPWRNIDNAGPAGSINSSVRDMSKWIALQLNDGVFNGKRLISSKNLQEMHQPQIVVPPGEIPDVFFPDSTQLTYSLGWFVQDYRGHQLILHPGDIDGFEALTVLIPEIHTGYEVLVNMGGDSYRQALGYHIADVLLHLPEKDWNAHFQELDAKYEAEEKQGNAAWQARRVAGTHPSHDLSAYGGTFGNDVDGTATLSTDRGKLVFAFHGKSSTLEHFEYDTFLIHFRSQDAAPSRITFDQDANGAISGFQFAGAHFQRQK